MMEHSQSSQNRRFAMSLEYLKKDVTDEVDFFYMEKNIKDFLKSILSSSVCGAKHAQITQKTSLLFLCNILKRSE